MDWRNSPRTDAERDKFWYCLLCAPAPLRENEYSYGTPSPTFLNRRTSSSILLSAGIIGDSTLELEFARFLDDCDDVVSFAKNYPAVNFKLDYVNADGDISNYYPDFLVKLSDQRIVVVETKGLKDLDVPLKMERLRQWCEDLNRIDTAVKYDFVYVDEESFKKYKPASFQELIDGFKEFKDRKDPHTFSP